VSAEPVRRLGRPPATVDGQTVPERLLEAALGLFAENGYEGTSVQDVVAAAGVTKGAMYHYFSSKDDLLHEIYARVLRMQTERLEKVVAQELPIAERVHAAAEDVVRTTIENLESTTIFFRSLHQLDAENQRTVRRQRRRYHELFRSMVVAGQQSGAFRDDIDAELAVDYFFGSVHHLPMWWKPGGGFAAAEVGSSFADLFLAGIVVR